MVNFNAVFSLKTKYSHLLSVLVIMKSSNLLVLSILQAARI